MKPEERVMRVVRAARTLRTDRLVDALASSTGLSRENVELGFDRHLELDPTRDEIASLVSSSQKAESVVVLLSSTVFVGALRAIAWAWAGAPRVIVRPSKREPHFARALVQAIDDPSVVIDESLDVTEITKGEIHVYGRAETIERLKNESRVRVVGHGPGMGVAITDGTGARDLAWDVIPFDQRGCLSPRVVFVLGDEARAAVFAEKLLGAIESTNIPRGELTASEREEASRWRATVSFGGTILTGTRATVAVSRDLVIPPSGRHVLVSPCSDPSAQIQRIERWITIVGTCEPAHRRFAPAHARVAPFGAMQRPPFDGPVDRRIVTADRSGSA